jgi:hypothetical protein
MIPLGLVGCQVRMVEVGEERLRFNDRGCEKQKENNAGTRPAAGVNKAKPGEAGLRMTYR